MPTNTNGELRARPRVNVTRGYPGNEPETITAALPVTGTVYSGQIVERTSANKFELADKSTAATSAYVAYHDSTDTDVTSCGKLLGFSAMGGFEIETAYADVNGLSVGSAVGVNASGSIAVQGGDTGATIGYVTEIRDLGVGGHTAGTYGTKYSGNARGGVPGTIPEDSTSDNYLDTDSAQVVTVTLSGTSGNYSIVVNGDTYTQAFDTDLGTTATALASKVNANAAVTAAGSSADVVITAAAAGDAGKFEASSSADTGDAAVSQAATTGNLDVMKIVKFVTSV